MLLLPKNIRAVKEKKGKKTCVELKGSPKMQIKKKANCNRSTDRPTNRPTDTVTYRSRCPRQKRKKDLCGTKTEPIINVFGGADVEPRGKEGKMGLRGDKRGKKAKGELG